MLQNSEIIPRLLILKMKEFYGYSVEGLIEIRDLACRKLYNIQGA